MSPATTPATVHENENAHGQEPEQPADSREHRCGKRDKEPCHRLAVLVRQSRDRGSDQQRHEQQRQEIPAPRRFDEVLRYESGEPGKERRVIWSERRLTSGIRHRRACLQDRDVRRIDREERNDRRRHDQGDHGAGKQHHDKECQRAAKEPAGRLVPRHSDHGRQRTGDHEWQYKEDERREPHLAHGPQDVGERLKPFVAHRMTGRA
jgi:hypothetical protein